MVVATLSVRQPIGRRGGDVAREHDHIGERAGAQHALAVLLELGIGALARVARQRLLEGLPLIGLVGVPALACQRCLDGGKRIDRRHRPVGGKHQAGAGVAQRPPGIGPWPPPAADPRHRRLARQAHGARRMPRLHRGDHAERPEPRDVRWVDDLDMLDAMPAVAAAIGRGGRLIAIEHRAHRLITDGMHRDLEPEPVGGHRNFSEMPGREQRLAAGPGLVGIILDHRCGPAFEDAVIEDLDEAGGERVGTIEVGHGARPCRAHRAA